VTDRSRQLRALAGLLTGLAGASVALATAAALRQRLDPVTAVAEAVVEVTPGKVAKALIDLVGSADKPLLIAGVVLGVLALSMVAGVLTRRSQWHGAAVFVGMALLSGVAVLTRPNTDSSALLPVLLGGVTWLAVLPLLTSPLQQAPSSDRRAFLMRAGVVAGASLVVGASSRFLGRRRRFVEEAREGLDLPVTDGAVPVGAELDVPDLTTWRTPNEEFYRIDTALVVPAVDVGTWRLRIHGMVERELTFTFDDLLDRQLSEAWVTLTCVSNPVGDDLVGNAWWSGVRVADLLAEAGPLDGADAVLQTSDDGWNCGTPLEVLTDDRNAMLAVAMNGEPLPLEHGFPVRMVVPGLYGYVSATKWLVDLEVTRFEDFSAFWTKQGWAPRGPIKTQSRIDVPAGNHRVTSGDVVVAGVAWAQATGIEGVEVRLDGGAWTPVELGRVPSVDTWVQWSGTVQVEPGVHTLAVRATDRSGYTQTGVQRDVLPDGATGWHTIEFTAE
jgi:DMSO/TMAO reductase YedYZ molybdopterin-dependent catalytic subunit